MGDPQGERRIAGITLDERTVVRRSPDIEHERAVAIFDLLEENHFAMGRFIFTWPSKRTG